MNSRLNGGRAAVITGAGGGIGREIVLTLADSGARVVINDIGVSLRGEGGLVSSAEEILGLVRQRGDGGLINTDNVADWDSARRIVECAVGGFERLGIVVNNAGILYNAILHKVGADDWLSTINAHLNGSFLVSRAAVEYFRTQQAGTFAHMTSTSGLIGNFGQTNYFAAKLGTVVLSKSTALDMQRYNVRSNCAASFAWSRMADSIPAEAPEQKTRVDKLQRVTPEKDAPLAIYLASDAAREITGQVPAARHHEFLLTSQSRPLRSAHDERGWTPENITEHGMPVLRGSFMDPARSLGVFSQDPT